MKEWGLKTPNQISKAKIGEKTLFFQSKTNKYFLCTESFKCFSKKY